MLKKILIGAFVLSASLVSFNIGRGGATVNVSATPKATACEYGMSRCCDIGIDCDDPYYAVCPFC